jgi:hypothetical protein
MNLPTLGRTVRGGGLPQIAQLQGTYDPKLTKLPKLTSALKRLENSAHWSARN